MDHIKASKPTVGTCGEAKTVYQANECCAGSAGKVLTQLSEQNAGGRDEWRVWR